MTKALTFAAVGSWLGVIGSAAMLKAEPVDAAQATVTVEVLIVSLIAASGSTATLVWWASRLMHTRDARLERLERWMNRDTPQHTGPPEKETRR